VSAACSLCVCVGVCHSGIRLKNSTSFFIYLVLIICFYSTKKKKMADKILPQRIRELVPESQAYMDLLAFERKLDQTIMRKRLDIQEALKRPIKQKRKLRIFISNTFNPAKPDAEDGEGTVASWELRVEGRLLEDVTTKQKRKFSSFFKSLVIELDKDLYGPDNHLVEWHRTATTQETDGFQVKRPGDVGVRCTVLLMLDYQPPQFKLDPRLARMLGIHTQTRPVIIQALWQYVKTHKLQDPHEREFINCDKYLQQIFETQRMKFSEIPQRLHALLMPPEPIIINHVISVDPNDQKKTACYDIDVEVDDTLKTQMNSFLLSTASQQEIAGLDNKIHETIETINQLKTQREFMLSFARDPQGFINDWLQSQCRDLKTMTDVVGNPEEERRAEFYYQPWAQEAVCRYFYSKVINYSFFYSSFHIMCLLFLTMPSSSVQTVRRIDKKFCRDILGSQRMNCNDFGDQMSFVFNA
uniref:DM2 domain-containing protein n=1 Tax=Amphiprion ocellaris TaxID=80972 RepID=A0AAQ5ZEF5_AMPOC